MDGARAQKRTGRILRNKWQLDAVIGVGGMAVVYSAHHRNGMRAAVKILHPEMSANEEIKKRFLREGYLANSVDHAGVVRVFDDDVDEDGSVYLVMELLSGETLDKRIARKKRDLRHEEAIKIADGILDVLSAAHEKGIVHRDIKPENIFITREGGVKLLDFGIARVREATTTSMTLAGSLLGTPSFMAPEQALGHIQDIDARTDIFAVGATIFMMLSGQYVHPGTTGNELLLAAMTKTARPLREVAPDVPPDLAAIVDRALAHDRANRWQTARDMQHALRACATAFALGSTSPVVSASVIPDLSARVAVTSQPTGSGVAQTIAGVPKPRPWGMIFLVALLATLVGAGIVSIILLMKKPKNETVISAPQPSAPSAVVSIAASLEPLPSASAPALSSAPIKPAVTPVYTAPVKKPQPSASVRTPPPSTTFDPGESRH